jgi:ProP effector
MSKNRMPYERVWKTRKLLADTFPSAFKGFGAPKPPLKVGIFKDVKRELPELSARALEAALNDYTSGPSYLREVKVGTPRVDITGAPAGEVTADQASYAKERWGVVIQQRKARRAARAVAETTAGGQAAPQQIQQVEYEEGVPSA